MKVLRDHRGLPIRLTDERLTHILQHPEMVGLETAIEETLVQPDRVVRSFTDPLARLYYRQYAATQVGEKYLCVVVKIVGDDAFIVTAYLTDVVKMGAQLWPKER